MRRMIPNNAWEQYKKTVGSLENKLEINPYMIHLQISPGDWDENNQATFTRPLYFGSNVKLIEVSDGDGSTSEQREAISAADLTFSHQAISNKLVVTANGTVPEIQINLNCVLWRIGFELFGPILPDQNI